MNALALRTTLIMVLLLSAARLNGGAADGQNGLDPGGIVEIGLAPRLAQRVVGRHEKTHGRRGAGQLSDVRQRCHAEGRRPELRRIARSILAGLSQGQRPHCQRR